MVLNPLRLFIVRLLAVFGCCLADLDVLKPENSPATGNNDNLPFLILDEASDAIVTDDSEPVGVQPPIEPPEVTGAGAAGMAGEGGEGGGGRSNLKGNP